MKCPNCGAVYDDSCRFCGLCGTPLEPEKKGTHRVPLLIVAALAVLGICVFFATGGGTSVQDSTPVQPRMFYMEDGWLCFDPSAYDGDGFLVIPDTVDGETVTRIGEGCFDGCTELVEVTLPDTVTYIGPSAFQDCDSLQAAELPEGTEYIGPSAFAGCDSLEAVHIPASVGYIGWDAFDECDSLSFIFYDGDSGKWFSLYSQEIGPDTWVCCSDGNYAQSE